MYIKVDEQKSERATSKELPTSCFTIIIDEIHVEFTLVDVCLFVMSSSQHCLRPMNQAVPSVLSLHSTARVLWLKHCCQCCHWPQWCPGHCPGHCQALPYDPVTASVKDFYQMWKFPEQRSKHCLPLLSLDFLLSQESPELWLGYQVTA